MIEIELRAEFRSSSVWRKEEDGSMKLFDFIDLIDLPISKDLYKAIREWSSRYTITLDRNYPLAPKFSNPDEEKAFIEDGYVLEKRLQDELGNNYKVTYFPRLP